MRNPNQLNLDVKDLCEPSGTWCPTASPTRVVSHRTSSSGVVLLWWVSVITSAVSGTRSVHQLSVTHGNRRGCGPPNIPGHRIATHCLTLPSRTLSETKGMSGAITPEVSHLSSGQEPKPRFRSGQNLHDIERPGAITDGAQRISRRTGTKSVGGASLTQSARAPWSVDLASA
jgi:hypothetical protein